MQKKLNFAQIFFISLAINVKETASAYIAFLLFSSPNIDWKECCLSYVLHSYSNVEGSSSTPKCVFSLQQQDGPNLLLQHTSEKHKTTNELNQIPSKPFAPFTVKDPFVCLDYNYVKENRHFCRITTALFSNLND